MISSLQGNGQSLQEDTDAASTQIQPDSTPVNYSNTPPAELNHLKAKDQLDEIKSLQTLIFQSLSLNEAKERLLALEGTIAVSCMNNIMQVSDCFAQTPFFSHLCILIYY